MATTECFALVRGSAIRVTELDLCGALPPDTLRFAVSKCVTKVTINEVTDAGYDEIIKNDDTERRLHLVQPDELTGYTMDINFAKTDPGMLALLSGMPLVTKDRPLIAGNPFGVCGFGTGGFGGEVGGTIDCIPIGTLEATETVITGFEVSTRRPPVAFALEVWSKIAGTSCQGGVQQWGYTLFPFVSNGVISGPIFENAMVSFNLKTARSRRGSQWGVGPYDVDGAGNPLSIPVSMDTNWRTALVTSPPPEETCGVVEFSALSA